MGEELQSKRPAKRPGRFLDRRDAGAVLGEALAAYRGTGALVLGIPRGGVVVAVEAARTLGADLDVIVARKVGAPGNPECAIGAVTADGGVFLDVATIRAIGVSELYLGAAIARERAEARRREGLYRGQRTAYSLQGRIVIVIDDGLATGATMRAAVRSIRKRAPAKVVVAVPVGLREACEDLRAEADALVCCSIPNPFIAVGLHYQHFGQLSDADVISVLSDVAITRVA